MHDPEILMFDTSFSHGITTVKIVNRLTGLVGTFLVKGHNVAASLIH